MTRCPSAASGWPATPTATARRCPACREPLYDEPPRGRDYQDGTCPAHPANRALGTCRRCGNYVCEVCRTRWRERWLCAACVNLALERKDAAPAEERAGLRQALLALGLGVVSWAVFMAGLVFVAAGESGNTFALLALGSLVILASPLPSVVGLGQGIAAIRGRGDHMILATIGLILCGLNVGAMIGLLSFGISMNQ